MSALYYSTTRKDRERFEAIMRVLVPGAHFLRTFDKGFDGGFYALAIGMAAHPQRTQVVDWSESSPEYGFCQKLYTAFNQLRSTYQGAYTDNNGILTADFLAALVSVYNCSGHGDAFQLWIAGDDARVVKKTRLVHDLVPKDVVIYKRQFTLGWEGCGYAESAHEKPFTHQTDLQITGTLSLQETDEQKHASWPPYHILYTPGTNYTSAFHALAKGIVLTFDHMFLDSRMIKVCSELSSLYEDVVKPDYQPTLNTDGSLSAYDLTVLINQWNSTHDEHVELWDCSIPGCLTKLSKAGVAGDNRVNLCRQNGYWYTCGRVKENLSRGEELSISVMERIRRRATNNTESEFGKTEVTSRSETTQGAHDFTDIFGGPGRVQGPQRIRLESEGAYFAAHLPRLHSQHPINLEYAATLRRTTPIVGDTFHAAELNTAHIPASAEQGIELHEYNNDNEGGETHDAGATDNSFKPSTSSTPTEVPHLVTSSPTAAAADPIRVATKATKCSRILSSVIDQINTTSDIQTTAIHDLTLAVKELAAQIATLSTSINNKEIVTEGGECNNITATEEEVNNKMVTEGEVNNKSSSDIEKSTTSASSGPGGEAVVTSMCANTDTMPLDQHQIDDQVQHAEEGAVDEETVYHSTYEGDWTPVHTPDGSTTGQD